MESTKVRIIATSDRKARDMTKEEYEACIPPCCSFQTMEEHENIGLCWSLATRVQLDKPIAGMCDDCTKNKVSPYGINSFGA